MQVYNNRVCLSLRTETLWAHFLGRPGRGRDVPNGSCGDVVAWLDATLALVRFDGYDFDLVIPTKYLHAGPRLEAKAA
jgi:hypothetical protein